MTEVNSGISYTFDVEVKNGFSVEYIDGEDVITAGTYSVIFAAYDKNSTLEGVEIKEVTFDSGGIMAISTRSDISYPMRLSAHPSHS